VALPDKLSKRAAKAGLVLPPDVSAQLTAYFELLRKWNRKVSLTALPVEEIGDEAVDRLLIEPALAAKSLVASDATAIDIGSGGGSPAIPLRIVAPALSMRMVESKTRKAAFLREVVRTLELPHTEVEAVRFEELLVRPELHESADVVTMRAVKIDAKMLGALQSLLKTDGRVFLFSTGTATTAQEIAPSLVSVTKKPLLKQWGSYLEILQKRST
jgi:16S rRNA (guanine527-N7)-methyltransferase